MAKNTNEVLENASHPLQLRGAQIVMIILLVSLGGHQCMRSFFDSSSNTRERLPSNVRKQPLQIDLNTANESALTLLPGLGDKLVRDLIASRSRLGTFDDWKDVENVDGMGPMTIEAIRPWCQLGSRPPFPSPKPTDDSIVLTAWND